MGVDRGGTHRYLWGFDLREILVARIRQWLDDRDSSVEDAEEVEGRWATGMRQPAGLAGVIVVSRENSGYKLVNTRLLTSPVDNPVCCW